jgi:hypothetical protein
MSNDIEIWLLFAPFWILGLGALIGAGWHFVNFRIHHGRAQAAGHATLTDTGRHHLRRGLIAVGAFVVLVLIGLGVAAALGLLFGR